jgi:hypothetical protein
MLQHLLRLLKLGSIPLLQVTLLQLLVLSGFLLC